ncbi:MAG: hypothetical protein ABSB35_15375 [Bryobacteraceae bacterium]
MRIRAALLAIALGMVACQNMPEPYAPPVQRKPFNDFHPRVVRVVNMADPDAHLSFVQDIAAGSSGSWRWTGKRPTIKLRLRSNENLKFVIDFTLPEVTFKDTGPVTVSFFVNDRELGEERYTTSGVKHFEQPIPASWVTPGQEATAAAEIDKVWVAKDDGATLGFIVTRMGITQ